MIQEKISLAHTINPEVVPAPSLGIVRIMMVTKVAPKTPPNHDHHGALDSISVRLAGGRPRTWISQKMHDAMVPVTQKCITDKVVRKIDYSEMPKSSL